MIALALDVAEGQLDVATIAKVLAAWAFPVPFHTTPETTKDSMPRR